MSKVSRVKTFYTNFQNYEFVILRMFAKMTPDTPDRSDTNHPGAWEI